MNYVIRSEEDKEKVLDAIRGSVGAWKLYIQPLLPKATPNQYHYLFGVVYKYIAEYAGYTNVQEVHRASMDYYNLEYVPLKNGWDLKVKSASDFSRVDITIYIEKLRSDWLLDCGLQIPDAREVFT